eukprot:Gb_15411 [translate_table: standard]
MLQQVFLASSGAVQKGKCLEEKHQDLSPQDDVKGKDIVLMVQVQAFLSFLRVVQMEM